MFDQRQTKHHILHGDTSNSPVHSMTITYFAKFELDCQGELSVVAPMLGTALLPRVLNQLWRLTV